MALEREGMEGEEVEQDIDIEGVEQEEEKTEEITTKEKETKSKDEEVKKTEKPEGVEKKTMVGHDPKLYKQYQYHSTLALGQLAKRKRMKKRRR